jgi:hypothetical protein
MGVELYCTGIWEGFRIKMFYMHLIPDIIGEHVKAGQKIGVAQAISRKWGNNMKDHVHVEVWNPQGETFDPEWLLMNHKKNQAPPA